MYSIFYTGVCSVTYLLFWCNFIIYVFLIIIYEQQFQQLVYSYIVGLLVN